MSFLLVLTLSTSLPASEERLILRPRIDGERVRMTIDTGNPIPLVLFSPTVKRLQLKTEEKEGKTLAVFDIELGGETYLQSRGLVMDVPQSANVDMDGLLGWPVLQGEVWLIDWERMSIFRLDSVPSITSSWQVFKLDRREPIAAAFLEDQAGGLMYLDTGNPGGISLSEVRWNQWVRENRDAPMTLNAGYMPAAGGLFRALQSWSDRYRLGPLTIPLVMIEKSPIKIWPRFEAALGLEALKHFEVVLDLKEGRIFMKGAPYAGLNIQYNRLGATFAPVSMESENLVAQVLEKSPAYKSGLRSGDILLKVDDIDMTRWKTDVSIGKRAFWSAAPGTKYTLEIERDGKKQVIQVVLREIFNIPRRER